MKLILAATVLLVPLAAADAQPRRQSVTGPTLRAQLVAPNATRCPTTQAQIAQGHVRNRSADVHRLDQEPPAQHLLAVHRQVGGCHELTFIRRNVWR